MCFCELEFVSKKVVCFLKRILIVLCYHELNKNAIDKSYFLEFSENLTTVVIEFVFAGHAMKERGTR